MELLRDLIRDLVGIIFPGSLIVIFTIWLLWGVFLPFNVTVDSSPVSLITSANNFAVLFALLVFSYVAGQLLRIRQLNYIEKKATDRLRKDAQKRKALLGLADIVNREAQEKPEIPETVFEAVKKAVDEESSEKGTSLGRRQLEQIYYGIRDWEVFPYPYTMKVRSRLWHPPAYFQFFRKYDEQQQEQGTTFFNYCKSAVYEYSPSFKEELIRQEALVRMLSGIFYALKYGLWVTALAGIVHLTFLWISREELTIDIAEIGKAPLHPSAGIVILSVLAFLAFRWAREDILNRIRRSRQKEVNLVFDAFYICCNRYEELKKLHGK